MDEPPILNGRVLSRELYTAISSLREEVASALRAQTADVEHGGQDRAAEHVGLLTLLGHVG